MKLRPKTHFALILITIASLMLCLTLDCPAAIIVWHGPLKITRFGNGTKVHLRAKTFCVYDNSSASLAKLTYFSSKEGLKVYTVERFDNVTTNQVLIGKDRTETVLATTSQVTNDNPGTLITSTFLSGPDLKAQLSGDTNLLVSIPKLPTWIRRTAGPLSSGTVIDIAETGTLAFDAERTRTNNTTSATLDAAVSSISTFLESRGYLITVFP